MIDKLSSQTRIILATVLSFLFFATYNYFFVPAKVVMQENNQTTQVEQSALNAPVTKSADLNKPASLATSQSQIKKSDGAIIATIKARNYEIRIDRLGRISKFYLNDKKYVDETGERVQLIDPTLTPAPLEIRFSDENINAEAFATSYEADSSDVVVGQNGTTLKLTQSLSQVKITKELTFFPNGHYSLHVSLNNPKEYFITPGFRPNSAIDMYTFHGSLVIESDGTLETIADGDAKGTENFSAVKIAAAVDKYYTSLFYNFNTGLDVVVSSVHEESALLFIKGKSDFTLSGYIGPKEHKILSSIDERLTNIIEYGFFTFISKPLFSLLSFLYSLFGNWGWAIVVMTILIRTVLFPLTYKGMVSMNKLKELSPKIKEMQAKYKGDKQKQNAMMMEMYKKHGANPMGGCLPMILQIPVFFSIYRVLQNTIELKSAPWIFWVEDLAVMDPYYILPVAMGITMFLHQRITPTNFTDPMQEKIMKFLPLIFTFFFVTFPAGLTLYWFTNNLFSIVQQTYVNRLFAKKKIVEVAAHKKEPLDKKALK